MIPLSCETVIFPSSPSQDIHLIAYRVLHNSPLVSRVNDCSALACTHLLEAQMFIRLWSLYSKNMALHSPLANIQSTSVFTLHSPEKGYLLSYPKEKLLLTIWA